jgi:hypothetical protein
VGDVVIGGGSVEGDGYWAGGCIDLGENGSTVGGPLGDAATAAVEEDREAGTRDVVLKLRRADFKMRRGGQIQIIRWTVVSEKCRICDAMLKPCNLVTSLGPGCGVFETESDGQPVLGRLVLIWAVKLRYRNSSLMARRYKR